MCEKFRRFLNDQSGVAAVEYGLIAALVAVALIVGARQLGSALSTKFSTIATDLS